MSETSEFTRLFNRVRTPATGPKLAHCLSDQTLEQTLHGAQRHLRYTKTKLNGRRLSGRALMKVGLPVDLYGDCDSRIFHIKAVR